MFQALKVLETGELLVLFCEGFEFLKILILCTSLSLNFSMKSLIERMPTEHSTFCISVIPSVKINPQY